MIRMHATDTYTNSASANGQGVFGDAVLLLLAAAEP